MLAETKAARDEAVGAVPSLILGNIAALRSFAAATAVVVASVLGYTAPLAPAGGGTFVLDTSGAPAVDDGGMVVIDEADRVWRRQVTDTRPEYWGATGYREHIDTFTGRIMAGTYVDEYASLKKAIDYLKSVDGGGTLLLSRFHVSNTPLIVPYGVNIVGLNRDTCGIWKDSATTVNVTYYGVAATPLVETYPGALPTAANAVLLLGDDNEPEGRWTGTLRGFSVGDALSNPADAESWKVEFGVLNVGNMAYVDMSELNIQTVERVLLIPSCWETEIHNIHAWRCRSGLGIENGTSTGICTFYANSCRDYGIAVRSLIYSFMGRNAVDFLNDPSLYADRTRECSAYVLNSAISVTAVSNGQEQTYGNSWVLDTLKYCQVTDNLAIGIGSDYSEANDIAFIKVRGALVGCTVERNNAFDQKPTGLISGGANAAKHHNLFEDGAVLWNGTSFHNNVVRDARAGGDTEGGWGNNNINEAFVVKRGGIYSRSEADLTYGNILRGTGATSATYLLDVRNGQGSSLLRLRDDGTVTALGMYQQTTGEAGNVFVGGDGSLFRSRFALKYKDAIGPIPDDMIEKVMAKVGFIYSQKGDEAKRRLVGLAADHFHDAGLTEFVH